MQSKLLYFAVFCVFVFLLTLNKWYIAASLIFLTVPFLLNVFKIFAIKEVDLQISRKLRPISDADNVVTVTLELVNLGEKTHWVEVEDLMDERLLNDGESNKWLFAFDKNEKKILTYELKAKRGFYQFKGVKVTCGDWFGINKKETIYSIQSHLQVNPNLGIKDRIELKSKLLHGFSGLINAKRAGAGVDFFGLREYNNQDSLKHIHWRASAKLQDGFLVKQYLVTKNSTAMIDIDTRSRLLPQNEQTRMLEYSLKAARYIADTLIDDGHKVGLSVEQSEQSVILPAKGSNIQKLRINQVLAGVSEYHGVGPKSLVNMPEMFLRNHSTLIIISALEHSDVKSLINLKRRGFNLICVSPDYSRLIIDNQENSDHINLKQKLLINGLLQKGVTVINWDVSQPFSHCVHQINRFGRTKR